MGSIINPLFACFYCGVDSKPLLYILFGIIGSLALGTVFCGLGLLMRGKFVDPELIKNEVFEAEKRY